jgi:hypothetical protein
MMRPQPFQIHAVRPVELRGNGIQARSFGIKLSRAGFNTPDRGAGSLEVPKPGRRLAVVLWVVAGAVTQWFLLNGQGGPRPPVVVPIGSRRYAMAMLDGNGDLPVDVHVKVLATRDERLLLN